MEDELPTACGGVQLLLQGLEVDALSLEMPDRLNEVLQGTAEPVQAPHNEGISLTEVSERLCKAWATRTGTRGPVGENPLTAGSSERVLLEREGLVKG
jgi:hypothetical protein